MEYSVNFIDNFKYEEEIQEYSINFFKDSSYSTLIKYLELVKEKGKRIKIKFDKEQAADLTIELLIPFKEMIVLELPIELANEEELKTIEKLKAEGIAFFFDVYAFNYDVVNGMIDLGVSDIKISGDLCFDIKAAAEFIRSHGVRVRVCPDIAQSEWSITPLPAHFYFFIRPEDIDIYSEYIDVLYFDSQAVTTIYEIYAKNKKWVENLSPLVGVDIDNRAILPNFGETRMRCKKRCKTGSGCHLCSSIASLSTTLVEQGLFLD